YRRRSREFLSALRCHLPREERVKVCWACAAILRTSLEEGAQPMMRIEAPQQDRLQHTEHPRRQVGAPHAARAVIVLAAHHRVAEYPLRAIIVHCHFWTPGKHGEPVPVGMQAAQDLVLDKVKVGLLPMRL